MSLLNDTISGIIPQDEVWRAKAKARLDQLTMPHWALGRLMDLAVDLAGITRSMNPNIKIKAIVTMAGDHGVVAEGVSKYPQEVTVQMVHNFIAGGAGVNALARQSGCDVHVVDMGVAGDLDALKGKKGFWFKRIAHGTNNIAVGPAMTRDQAIQSIEAGIQIAKELGESVDVFGTGDMGIGNTSPSSAIISAVTGASVSKCQ
jgi:nicotinate-nucleotide--dimethylbenzimidazole phosphoribosyltransferase